MLCYVLSCNELSDFEREVLWKRDVVRVEGHSEKETSFPLTHAGVRQKARRCRSTGQDDAGPEWEPRMPGTTLCPDL